MKSPQRIDNFMKIYLGEINGMRKYVNELLID